MAFKFVSMDGNTAAAHVAYAFTEFAGIFPITPSSPMAENIDEWTAQGRKNVFGSKVKVVEMQSEGGASGTVHGAAEAGALAATYTASQGLLLMIPNIYKCVGELLPVVFHVSARALATRSLAIFGDHQDIYACRQTGVAMLCEHSVQEIMDLSPVAHLSAIEGSYPFINFFDGFRTSHEIDKVETWDYEDLKALITPEVETAIKEFKRNALNPHTNPITRGGAENDDIYFQGREAANLATDRLVGIVEKHMKKISEVTHRHYAPFVYEGASDATDVIIAMGSVTETMKEVVADLTAKGKKVGMVKVYLYRPFSSSHLANVIPTTVKRIAVLDRTKEPGALGDPLYLDVVAALAQQGRKIKVIGGRYGLASRDTQPKHIKSVFDFMKSAAAHTDFTVGINDDVTFKSIPVDEKYHIKGDYTSCLFWGLGSDGTVSANKNSIKIIGDHTDKYVQAYFQYDSKKSGGVTRSHLRFGNSPIHSTYYIEHADFMSCSLDEYIFKYDLLKSLAVGGTFLLNTTFSADEIEDKLPNSFKKALAEKKAKFYIINATAIAAKIGMGRRTNTILQSSFFKLANIMPYDEAVEYMKAAAKKSYSKKGEEIVKMNYVAIEKGGQVKRVSVKPEWKNLVVNPVKKPGISEYFDEYATEINDLRGYDLPVSAFLKGDLLKGSMEANTTYFEKRNIATEVPHWHSENCIQCGNCVIVCPHATIRAFLPTDEEVAAAPSLGQDVLKAMGPGMAQYKYRIQVSPDNCVGCGLCVSECPGKKDLATGEIKKALSMQDVKGEMAQSEVADYYYLKVPYRTPMNTNTVKGASFLKPYFEVSGSCAGCGETPYYRLISQLFGKDLLIGNATGCSSIYCGSTPSTPFVKDENGQGPAWANSLFEDNAEYAYGMRVATNIKLSEVCQIIKDNIADCEEPLQALLNKYVANISNKDVTRAMLNELLDAIKASKNEGIKALLARQGDLVDKSVWAIGGDGWGYDIGYGGLDHVIASNDNINVLILDTEIYSNTGGQASKSTPEGAIAKFAAAGKQTAKKDMASIAMAYGHVYVASISMGADRNQAIKALKEAESYDGPSLILAYSPCISQGIKGGLVNHQKSQKEATRVGYWPIFRYDPRREEQGLNPFQLDCKEPDFEGYRNYLLSQTRYSQLPKVNPDEAERLLTENQKYAMKRWAKLAKMAKVEE
ncbi:MAG: pyruvate:ferredoxin (flavodoxin) oxidoreductase [Erysipelotrichaceae bacterium]|nr:pyruvate:ferredoxin (flavodoxin) oxidoreductase [Erysipelotrichaceae bacterium]